MPILREIAQLSLQKVLLSAALILLLGVRPLNAVDKWVNPGTMGPNALPSYIGDGPWTLDHTQLHIGWSGQLTHRHDHSTAPVFRLEAPFGPWVTLISEGMPVEFWQVSRRTAREWSLDKNPGISKGDLRFGAKVLFFDGKSRWPSLALRQITKTTTGKNYRYRRFTNAPGYWLDGILGYPLDFGEHGKLELWLVMGLFAWQQGADGQNDALSWSATANYRPAFGGHFRAEFRGYVGWQEHSTPVVASISAQWPLNRHLGLWISTNLGILDAPTLDSQMGIALTLPNLLPLIWPDAEESSPQPDSADDHPQPPRD